MILVDSSIWADHIHHPVAQLSKLLTAQTVAIHPFVIGEIMLGNIAKRAPTLKLLRTLYQTPLAHDDEVIDLIDSNKLFGSGIGYVDAHLLASTLLMFGGKLWTRDRRLHAAAERLGIALNV